VSLSERIGAMGPFRLLTSGDQLPVFAFTLDDDVTGFSVFDVSAHLREAGWLVPAYAFPENRTDLSVLRIVVRNGMTHDLADLLIDDLRRVVEQLGKQERPLRGKEASSFAHGTR
jgi:glutamate decarboxylase